MMEPEFVFMNDTLDIDEFLYDVSMHLRRREMKLLLNYIGLNGKQIDSLLYENMPRTWTERGLLTDQGTVVEGSSSVSFMLQRRKSMQTWWEYAANTRQRNTPAQQKLKVVESSPYTLPQIPEDGSVAKNTDANDISNKQTDTFPFPRLLPAPIKKHFPDTLLSEDQVSVDASTSTTFNHHNMTAGDKSEKHNINTDSQSKHREVSSADVPTRKILVKTPLYTSGRAHVDDNTKKSNVSLPLISLLSDTTSDDTLTSNQYREKLGIEPTPSEQIMLDKSQQTDIVGCDIPPDQVSVYGSTVTLEELLRKLWKSLQACGLNRVVEELQQRWMIRVNMNQGRADMYPKMTWGTPPPPQTPFTYPPYKRIGHMAVMGSTISIEAKPIVYPSSELTPRFSKLDSESMTTTTRSANLEPLQQAKFMPTSARENSKLRSARSSRGPTSISLDGTPVTSFPTRDAWKLRTDTVRRKGASIAIHVMIDDVTLPAQPSTAWGTSLNVTTQQIRERVARVFLSHSLQDSKNLCKAVDRIERIRGLIVESALRRIGGGGNGLEITSSELVLQSRCLYPETVEQLWLLYQSGQLREAVQAGLVTKRSLLACSVENLRMRVVVLEEEYRRALGLLRRKPMPNTKTGRFYVTSGTGGAIGGVAGMGNAQKQALVSVTRYIKLPDPAPNFDILNPVDPSGGPLLSESTKHHQTSSSFQSKAKHAGSLVQKVLSKELDALKERLRMCEDSWCDFVSNQFTHMLRCARHVMKRRIVGATAKTQLTPRCTSLSVFSALYKAIKSPKLNGVVASPRSHHVTAIAGNHSSIALYPSDVTFSSVDLVTTVDDDDDVVKARKKEERDFVQGYALFRNILAELGTCRNILQERIINRLTTNPTVAPSKHLYLAKDIYNLMERWRHHLVQDFNFANDETVQRFSLRILSNDIVTTSFDKEIQEQFPGIVGLLPMIFHIADQIMFKVRELIPRPASQLSSTAYPSISTSRSGVIPSRHLSLWLKA